MHPSQIPSAALSTAVRRALLHSRRTAGIPPLHVMTRPADTPLASGLPKTVWYALGVGLALRLFSAWWCDGYFATDCYFHVLDPAWRWLYQPTAGMPSNFRSAFLPLLLHGVMRLGRAGGMETPATLLHLAYSALSLWSLLAVVFTYRLARLHLDHTVSAVAAWLVAAHCLMPHISAQALVEAAAAPPLMGALWLFERMRCQAQPRFVDGAAVGALLGLSAMFRFHVGLVFIVCLVFAVRHRNRGVMVASLMVGGVAAALAQGILDFTTQGGFMVVPFRYVAYQLQWASGYGVMPWYVFLGFFVGMSLPPFSLVLLPAWRTVWNVMRTYAAVSVAFVLFVLAHSAVGHKEERFMFTVMPVFLLYISVALVHAWRSASAWRRWGVAGWALANALLLLVFTSWDPRRNVNEPLKELAVMEGHRAAIGLGADIRLAPLYAGWNNQVLEAFEDPDKLTQLWQNDVTGNHVRLILGSDRKDTQPLDGWTCDDGRLYSGDAIDRFLIWVNPGPNHSRMPTTVRDCVRTGL